MESAGEDNKDNDPDFNNPGAKLDTTNKTQDDELIEGMISPGFYLNN